MSDELECFKKCAELGCPDFTLHGRDILLFTYCGIWELLPNNVPRINRYAAAVCAEWWYSRSIQKCDQIDERRYCLDMIDLARAFASKHGELK